MLHKIVQFIIQKKIEIMGNIINIDTSGSLKILKSNSKLSVSPEERCK